MKMRVYLYLREHGIKQGFCLCDKICKMPFPGHIFHSVQCGSKISIRLYEFSVRNLFASGSPRLKLLHFDSGITQNGLEW